MEHSANTCSSTSRNVWKDAEVKCLLEIFQEEKVLTLFDGKRYKNAEIYKLVEQKMIERGYKSKSTDQVKNKWKSLKSQYNNCVKNNSRSGMDRSECEYFGLLEAILGGRPSSALEGIDTEVIVELGEDISSQELSDLLQSTESDSDAQHEQTPKSRDSRASVEKIYNSVRSSARGKENDMFFKQQMSLMTEFFERQEKAQERAATARSEDLKNILKTFSTTVENILRTPFPSMAYNPYMVPAVPSPASSRPSSSFRRPASAMNSSDEEYEEGQQIVKKSKKDFNNLLIVCGLFKSEIYVSEYSIFFLVYNMSETF